MLISEKQHEANRQNALHSTGPTTPEGRAAVRLNALTYGLRARSTLLPGEDPEEYKQLWAALESEWQPQTPTERLHLEQMCTSQWLLARIAAGESQVYESNLPTADQFMLLGQVSKYRTSLERSFASALRELKQSKRERQARPQPQPAQTAKPEPVTATPPAEPAAPPPNYVMSEATEIHQVFCAPATTDSR
jgi:hypothetical protein